MLPQNRIPSHPGEILKEEFLLPLGLSEAALAEHIDVPVQHILDLVKETCEVTPEMAWRLAQAFGTTPELWANLQSNYNLARNRPETHIEPLQRLG